MLGDTQDEEGLMTSSHHNTAEQRSEVRQWHGGLPAGELRVVTQGRVWRVVAVRDVSPSGVSLCVEEPLEIGQRVSLVWHRDGLHAEFSGFVAWSAASDSLADLPPECAGRQVVGLSMTGPQQLVCLLQR